MLLENLHLWNVHLRWQWRRHVVIWIWNAKSYIFSCESNLHWSRGMYNGSHYSESYLESCSTYYVTDGHFWRYNVVQSERHLLLRIGRKQRNPRRSCKLAFHFAHPISTMISMSPLSSSENSMIAPLDNSTDGVFFILPRVLREWSNDGRIGINRT